MITTIIIFIITLLFLVVSHEFGHFIVAKKFKVKVEEFGFGLPPKIWGKKIGETLVTLNWLPIGGFVRLFGEDQVDKKILHNPRSFAAAKVGVRIGVVVAGVIVNLLLAWILFYIVLFNNNFQIIYPTLKQVAYVAQVEQNSPAEIAGIKTGEIIISVDQKPINDVEEVRNLIKDKANQKVEITLINIDGSQKQTLTVIPKIDPLGNTRIGVAFSPVAFKTFPTLKDKILSAPSYSWDLTKLTFQGFAMLIKDLVQGDFGQASKSVSGPIGIAVATNNVVNSGVLSLYLWFVGYLSLSLAIINILPFPALDGGRLVFLLIEALTRKKVKPEIERLVHSAGMAILLALVILVTFSDIKKFF